MCACRELLCDLGAELYPTKQTLSALLLGHLDRLRVSETRVTASIREPASMLQTEYKRTLSRCFFHHMPDMCQVYQYYEACDREGTGVPVNDLSCCQPTVFGGYRTGPGKGKTVRLTLAKSTRT